MTSLPHAEIVGRAVSAPSGTMRVPPHDNDAEQAVLGGILIDREAMAAVRDVLEAIFWAVSPMLWALSVVVWAARRPAGAGRGDVLD